MKFRNDGETMKIVVMSDSHGCNSEIEYVLNNEKDADMFLHCGDICVDQYVYPDLISVRGNNDYYDYPMQRIINLKKHRILMLHSHTISFMKREEYLVKNAKEHGCDIVCFGHTHIALVKEMQGVHLVNPGSLYCSRDGRSPSYAVIEVEDDKINIKIKFLEE